MLNYEFNYNPDYDNQWLEIEDVFIKYDLISDNGNLKIILYYQFKDFVPNNTAITIKINVNDHYAEVDIIKNDNFWHRYDHVVQLTKKKKKSKKHNDVTPKFYVKPHVKPKNPRNIFKQDDPDPPDINDNDNQSKPPRKKSSDFKWTNYDNDDDSNHVDVNTQWGRRKRKDQLMKNLLKDIVPYANFYINNVDYACNLAQTNVDVIGGHCYIDPFFAQSYIDYNHGGRLNCGGSLNWPPSYSYFNFRNNKSFVVGEDTKFCLNSVPIIIHDNVGNNYEISDKVPLVGNFTFYDWRILDINYLNNNVPKPKDTLVEYFLDEFKKSLLEDIEPAVEYYLSVEDGYNKILNELGSNNKKSYEVVKNELAGAVSTGVIMATSTLAANIIESAAYGNITAAAWYDVIVSAWGGITIELFSTVTMFLLSIIGTIISVAIIKAIYKASKKTLIRSLTRTTTVKTTSDYDILKIKDPFVNEYQRYELHSNTTLVWGREYQANPGNIITTTFNPLDGPLGWHNNTTMAYEYDYRTGKNVYYAELFRPCKTSGDCICNGCVRGQWNLLVGDWKGKAKNLNGTGCKSLI